MSSSEQDKWSHRSGTGIGALIGLPFLLGGCFFFYGGLTAEEINDGPPSVALRTFFCAFSSIFIIIGFAIVFGYSKVIIDKVHQQITFISGALFPLKIKKQNYQKVEAIEFRREVRTTRSNNRTRTYSVYPIRIYGEPNIDLFEVQDLFKARQKSEEIAKFLSCGVMDSCSPEGELRDHDELDQSVFDRNKNQNIDSSKPTPPDSLNNFINYDYAYQGGRTFVSLGNPSKENPKILYLSIAIFAVFVSLCFLLFQPSNAEDWTNFLLESFFNQLRLSFIICFFLSYTFFKFIIRGIKITTAEVGKYQLVIHEGILGIPFKTSYSKEEIEELKLKQVSSNHSTASIELRTDHHKKEFAKYHPKDEVQYLHDLILFEMKS